MKKKVELQVRQPYPETIQVTLTFHKWSNFVKDNDLQQLDGKLCVIYPIGSDFPLQCIYHHKEKVFTVVGRMLGGCYDISFRRVLYVTFDTLFEKLSFDHYK